MLGRRIGRGGLLRAAVIAGTATAVSGRVQDRRAARAQQAADADEYQWQQQQAQIDTAVRQAVTAAQPAAPPPAPSSGGSDLLTSLQNLAALHSQGILSDSEFAAAKAKLLA